MSGTAQTVKATYIRMPHDLGPGTTPGSTRTQNDFGVKKITTSVASTYEALQYEFSGQYIFMRFIGATAGDSVTVACTIRTGGTVDVSAASSNNVSTPGVTLQAGMTLVSGEAYVQVQLPSWDRNEQGYLIHDATSAGTLIVMKGS